MRKIMLLTLMIAGRTFAADTGVKAVDAAWLKAMQTNSVDAVMACYATNAVAWLPEQAEANGVKAIRTAYEGMLGANTIKSAALSDTHYDNSGKLAAGWGHFSITVLDKATGQTNVWNGRFTGLAERRNGRWVYVVDHASAEPEPVPKP